MLTPELHHRIGFQYREAHSPNAGRPRCRRFYFPLFKVWFNLLSGMAALPQLPIERWITPKQLAEHFGLKVDSAYRWIDEETVDSRFVKRCGTRRLLIHPAALPELEKIFAAEHNREACRR